MNRMQFLRGDFSGRHAPVRPPWALPEVMFTESCNRCGDCVTACPAGILLQGRGGFPQVDFSRGECEFCGACAMACKPRALIQPSDMPAWSIKVRLQDSCLAKHGVVCRTCSEQCEAGAIRFRLGARGISTPQINAAACTGCGACIAPCPSASLQVYRDASSPSTIHHEDVTA